MQKSCIKAIGLISVSAQMLFATTSVAPSQNPPGNLTVEQTPQFISIGFDDNAYSGLDGTYGGMAWATDFLDTLKNVDETPVRANFYFTSVYIATHGNENQSFVRKAWRTALEDGHEIGNHTYNHPDGTSATVATWQNQISLMESWVTKPYLENSSNDTNGIGITKSEMYGFRSPYLHYNNNLFTVLRTNNYLYDCSIEEGWQDTIDGSNFHWPYTLDHASPVHSYLQDVNFSIVGASNRPTGALTNHPGLWEMPAYPVTVPPDSLCAQYGVSYSIRDTVKSRYSEFNVNDGKLTGLDYTLFVDAEMNKAEVLATLKYSLDIRLEGNRAPMLFGAHTDEYSPKYTFAPNITATERQECIEEFITYALSKPEVRITTAKNIIDWMKNPTALSDSIVIKRTVNASVLGHEVTSGTSCNVTAWNSTTIYLGNDSCSYDGNIWRAKWWTENETPGDYGVWEDKGVCAGGIETLYYGSMSPVGNVRVDDGENITFTFTPDTGYEVKSILVNGTAVTSALTHTISAIDENKTLTVEFGAIASNRANASNQNFGQDIASDESAIEVIDSPTYEVSQMVIFPNPVSRSAGEVTLYFPQNIVGTGTCTIYDAQGNRIDHQNVNLARSKAIRWDLCNEQGRRVAAGGYLAVLEITDNMGQKHFQKAMIGVKQ